MPRKLNSNKDKIEEVYRMYFQGGYKLKAYTYSDSTIIHYSMTTYDDHGYTEQRNYFTLEHK